MRGLVPPTHGLRVYAVCNVVDAIGRGLYATGSVLFLTRERHFSAGFVGLALTVAALVGLLATVPAGRLSDRVGRKATFVPLYAALAVLYCLVPAVSGRAGVVVLLCLISSGENAARPIRFAALSDLSDGAERVSAAAYSRVIVNAGFGVGAALAAGALAIGSPRAYDALLIGNGVSFVLAGALFLKLPLRPEVAHEHEIALRSSAFRDLPYMLLAFSTGVLMNSEVLMYVALPLEVARHRDLPDWIVGAAVLLNVLIVVVFQVRVSRGSEDLGRAARASLYGGVALLACCLVFAVLDHDPGHGVAVVVVLAAMALMTLGEIWLAAGQWGVSYGLSPRHRQGEYLAAFGVVGQAIAVAAPVLAAAVVTHGLVAWIGAGLVFLAAGAMAPPVVSSRVVSSRLVSARAPQVAQERRFGGVVDELVGHVQREGEP